MHTAHEPKQHQPTNKPNKKTFLKQNQPTNKQFIYKFGENYKSYQKDCHFTDTTQSHISFSPVRWLSHSLAPDELGSAKLNQQRYERTIATTKTPATAYLKKKEKKKEQGYFIIYFSIVLYVSTISICASIVWQEMCFIFAFFVF